jgi:hypothetical protein
MALPLSLTTFRAIPKDFFDNPEFAKKLDEIKDIQPITNEQKWVLGKYAIKKSAPILVGTAGSVVATPAIGAVAGIATKIGIDIAGLCYDFWKAGKKPEVAKGVDHFVASYYYHLHNIPSPITTEKIVEIYTKQAILEKPALATMTKEQQIVEMRNTITGNLNKVKQEITLASKTPTQEILQENLLNLSNVLVTANAFASFAGLKSSKLSGFANIASGGAALHSALSVAKTVGTFGSCIPVVGAGLMVLGGLFSLFSDDEGGDGGLSNALADISDQIYKLGGYVKERFDIVDARIRQNHKEVMYAMDQIFFHQHRNQQELITLIKTQSKLLVGKLNALEEVLIRFETKFDKFNELYMQNSYSQMRELYFLQQQPTRRLEREIRNVIKANNATELENRFGDLAKQLTLEIIDPDESPSMTGKDLDLSRDNDMIKQRLIIPYFDNVEHVDDLMACNLYALMRHAISFGAYQGNLDSISHLKLLENRVWLLREFYKKHGNNVKKEIKEYVQDVVDKVDGVSGIIGGVDKKVLFGKIKKKISDRLNDLKDKIEKIVILNVYLLKKKSEERANKQLTKAKEITNYISSLIQNVPTKNQNFFDQIIRTVPYSLPYYSGILSPETKIQEGICRYWLSRGNSDLFSYGSNGECHFFNVKGRSTQHLKPPVYNLYSLISVLGNSYETNQNFKNESTTRYNRYLTKSMDSYIKNPTKNIGPRVFEPININAGTLYLSYYDNSNSSNIYFEKIIPEYAIICESEGFGEIKLTYDSSMTHETITLILKGSFFPYNQSYPEIIFFEENVTSKIIGNLYSSKDIAIFNWFFGKIYIKDTAVEQMTFFDSKTETNVPNELLLPPLYTVNRYSPMTTINEKYKDLLDNITKNLQQKMIDFYNKVKMKRKAEIEQQIKALDYAPIEKEMIILSLFAKLYSTNHQISITRFSDITNPDELLKAIDDTITSINIFQPDGDYEKLLFLKK